MHIAQFKANETKAWFRGLLCNLARKQMRSILQLPGPHRATTQHNKSVNQSLQESPASGKVSARQ